MAPAGTPRTLLLQLNKEVLEIVQAPETRELLATMALTPVPLPLDAVQERLTREFDKWQRQVSAR